MARVTIEDSMKHCPNIFSLIKLASQRAHQLQHGAIPKIAVRKNEEGRVDAPTVFALREIAAGYVDFDNEVIPQKDIWGNAIVPTTNVEEPKTIVATDEELYSIQNKKTKEIIKTGLTLDEAKEFKDAIVERIKEIRETRKEEE